ncbi:hypothetical protein PQR72_23375 [Paraburkholderia madseniana]|uniref:DUF6723 family protein n=1 Tax=Paraburkholderia madseniana TaxID=2599607 RepID=UPI0015C5559D|nr:DUF6723 family protein [Paraburkholderia madseniana]NPT67061.1 hypothetical protein [Paraburkholderia madseniana]
MPRHKANLIDEAVEIFATYERLSDGRYAGKLRVLRKADRKLLFPFDGAPQIGPYETPEAARQAALDYGRKIAAGDRAAPER